MSTDHNDFLKETEDELLFNYLICSGYLFPIDRENIKIIEQRIENGEFELPADISDSSNILKRKLHLTPDVESTELSNITSLAARNFASLPEEIKEKMREDREKSKKGE
jgi:hypothetical protein